MSRLALALVAALGLSGCLDRMILDGTLKSTRDASKAFDTLSDLEVAKEGAGSSLVQLEGMQTLAPDNEDGLFLLVQGWTGYASAFIEDAWERAVDAGDDDGETLHAGRAEQAYARAVHFGTLLLEQKRPGFAAAQKNADTMAAYLKGFGKEDAETLLWVGAAWLSRGGVAAEKPEVVADLFVGVALLERSVELEPTLAYGLGLSALGAYHARAPDAELGQAKALFEQALSLTHRQALTVQLMYAQAWACNAHDEAQYRALLKEVVDAGDVLPAQRLENTIARKKALRYLGAPRLARCGFTARAP
ncbi:MAG: TRAP transporter TatT component family protein [Myxococcaceae bacterium]|nr:TRAP transporter TatT component family protein [Myxococcaceae bacterium]